MIRQFDEWLLDRVFQPVVDFVADWADAITLGGWMARGAVLLGAVLATASIAIDSNWVGGMLSTVITPIYCATVAFRIERAARAARRSCGARNPLRIEFHEARLISVIGVFSVCVVAANGHGSRVVHLMAYGLGAWMFAMLYIASCDVSPPRSFAMQGAT